MFYFLVVFGLTVRTLEDLRRRLKEIGCSDRAVEEILKWFMPDHSDLD